MESADHKETAGEKKEIAKPVEVESKWDSYESGTEKEDDE